MADVTAGPTRTSKAEDRVLLACFLPVPVSRVPRLGQGRLRAAVGARGPARVAAGPGARGRAPAVLGPVVGDPPDSRADRVRLEAARSRVEPRALRAA